MATCRKRATTNANGGTGRQRVTRAGQCRPEERRPGALECQRCCLTLTPDEMTSPRQGGKAEALTTTKDPWHLVRGRRKRSEQRSPCASTTIAFEPMVEARPNPCHMPHTHLGRNMCTAI